MYEVNGDGVPGQRYEGGRSLFPDDNELVLLRPLIGLGPLGIDSIRTLGGGKVSLRGEKVSGRGLEGTKDARRGDDVLRPPRLLSRSPLSIILLLVAVPTPAILEGLPPGCKPPIPNSARSSNLESPRVCATKGTRTD